MTERKARQYLLVAPEDCLAPHSLDLRPGSRDELKVQALVEMFARDGFDPSCSALVGYPSKGLIQLASGTHRLEAARRAGIRLPVTLMLRSDIEALWGTPGWAAFIADIAVKNLELAPVPPAGAPPGLDERVDLDRDYDAPGAPACGYAGCTARRDRQYVFGAVKAGPIPLCPEHGPVFERLVAERKLAGHVEAF
jgi:hypothetical protein